MPFPIGTTSFLRFKMGQKSLSTNSATYRSSKLGWWHSTRAVSRLSLPLLALVTQAAVPVISTMGDNHTRWNSAAGFTGGHVYSITQTSDGYLWIAASNGLIRFDGLN